MTSEVLGNLMACSGPLLLNSNNENSSFQDLPYKVFGSQWGWELVRNGNCFSLSFLKYFRTGYKTLLLWGSLMIIVWGIWQIDCKFDFWVNLWRKGKKDCYQLRSFPGSKRDTLWGWRKCCEVFHWTFGWNLEITNM